MIELTHLRLLKELAYDPDTGVFTRLVRSSNRVKAGDVAGTKHSLGHVVVSVGGGRYYAHRLAWFYTHGEWPMQMVDHINGVRDDNRLANLREATPQQNGQNKSSKGGALGTSWHKAQNKWQSHIRGADRKLVYLGTYETREAAHEAYKNAKRVYHAEFQPEVRQ